MGTAVRRKNEAVFYTEQSHRMCCACPQFPQLKMTKGTFANLGMYIAGIPVGLFVDSKGPKPGVVLGGCLLSTGYFSMHRGCVVAISTVSFTDPSKPLRVGPARFIYLGCASSPL